MQKKVVSKFIQSENNMADGAENQPEKLFVMHVAKFKNETHWISQRKYVRDSGETRSQN